MKKQIILIILSLFLGFKISMGQNSVPLPNWDFYIGDSVVASSNVEVQNTSRPIIYYNLNDTSSSLMCILRTFLTGKEGNNNSLGTIELYLKEKRVLQSTRRGKSYQNTFNEIVFILNNGILGAELKYMVGEKLKITFQDESFQITPTVLGYLVVQEK